MSALGSADQLDLAKKNLIQKLAELTGAAAAGGPAGPRKAFELGASQRSNKDFNKMYQKRDRGGRASSPVLSLTASSVCSFV